MQICHVYERNFFVIVDSEDFKNGVNTLAQMLNITCHPDHLITLQAVSKVVCERLNAEAIQNPDSVIPKVCSSLIHHLTSCLW